ncbi:MAG: HIT domain-containing protein [Myxococcota bacterium]
MTERAPLWAPWRMEYVGGPKSQTCIFCEPEEPVSDRERLVLYRGTHVLAMLNRYPYAVGHLMVAPYAHVGQLFELPNEVQGELIGCTSACQRILQEAYDPGGINLGGNFGSAAGAGFADHLHLHLVPRWVGDTNFMTVVAETRVIPEHLELTYEELAPRFAELCP